MDEFSLIEQYFAPLARDFGGSLNLIDDAALIAPPYGHELVITKDAISEGIHFLGSEDPALIAQKLLRVNLSDLAAMGARPLCYFLAVMLPKNTQPSWIKRFAEGLAQDQERFGIHLAGGDTTATLGPASFSITALGSIKQGTALKRSGAKAGDDIYVSGSLGDSALGLALLQRNITLPLAPEYQAFLEERYYLPLPRLALGEKLIGLASAAIDISDGLLQDSGHVCKASGVGAIIERALLPLSPAAIALIKEDNDLWDHVLSGGDDYELLFTAPREYAPLIGVLSQELDLPLTCIGSIAQGNSITLLDERGKPITAKRQGFRHF